MGNSLVSPLLDASILGARTQSLLAELLQRLNHSSDTTEATESTDTAAAVPTDTLGANQDAQVDDAFQSSVYQSKMQRVSLAVQLQQVRTRIGEYIEQNSDAEGSETDAGASDTAATAEAKQLKFDFFAETRSVELALFQQRTDAVASKVGGEQGQQFTAVSQQVSFRFQMSLEITGAALSGYAGAAENLSDSSSDALDTFMSFANDLLEKTNDFMNQALEMLQGFFSGGETNIQDQLNQFLQGLSDIGFLNLDNIQGLTSSDDASSQAANTQNANTQNATVQVMGMSFNIEIQMEFAFSYEELGVQQSDPITFDLDGDGVELTGYANGANFDITGSGQKVNTAFVEGGDAFLVFDRNNNGSVDNGKELFGDQNGASNGFEELRKLDSNKDGVIDSNDKDFAQLKLFKDNGNGITEEGELVSLADEGITSISLGYKDVDEAAANGNRITQTASFIRNNGRSGRVVDAVLNYLA